MTTKLTFAVLVDAENASYGQYAAMLDEVEKYGSAAIKWVYADWTSQHQSAWKEVLHETASSPKQQFHYGKDAADHALVMDAIELISKNDRINAICIASSDGGFYSLAQRVREHGLHVMAIGKGNTPERFRKACHNFVFTDNLIEPTTSLSHNDLDALLVDAYQRCAVNNEPVYLGDMGSMLKILDSSFDPRTYGFQSLKKLIKDKAKLFDIVQEHSDRCFIALKLKAASDGSNFLNGKVRIWDRIRKFGFIKSPDGDFYFSARELQMSENSIKKGITVTFNAAAVGKVMNEEGNQSSSAYNISIKTQ